MRGDSQTWESGTWGPGRASSAWEDWLSWERGKVSSPACKGNAPLLLSFQTSPQRSPGGPCSLVSEAEYIHDGLNSGSLERLLCSGLSKGLQLRKRSHASSVFGENPVSQAFPACSERQALHRSRGRSLSFGGLGRQMLRARAWACTAAKWGRAWGSVGLVQLWGSS